MPTIRLSGALGALALGYLVVAAFSFPVLVVLAAL